MSDELDADDTPPPPPPPAPAPPPPPPPPPPPSRPPPSSDSLPPFAPPPPPAPVPEPPATFDPPGQPETAPFDRDAIFHSPDTAPPPAGAPSAPPDAAPVPPPVAAEPMPDAAGGPGLTDPAGLGAAVARLSGSSRKAGHAAFMVLARSLEPGEQVSVAAQCRFRGAPGAVALTDQRLIVVNSREWEPDVLPVGLEPGLVVQGWQDERHAALVFTRDGRDLVIDKISDSALAQEIAVGVRGRAGG